MDIMKLGTQLLMSKLGASGAGQDTNAIQSALGGLLGAGDSLDIGSLLGGLQKGGLADVAKSWLGDGDNAPISAEQVKGMVDGDKLGQLVSMLGGNEGSVLSGLQEAIPQMVDKSSSGGSLLDMVGGLGGVANLAKSFLK